MTASYEDRWEKLDEIGSGGQGKVFLVRDRNSIGDPKLFRREIVQGVDLIDPTHHSDEAEAASRFCNMINKIVDANHPRHLAALKVLHTDGAARDAVRAEPRIKSEIEAMSIIEHPGLLKLVDTNKQDCWYVAEYHKNGTLDQHSERFAGDLTEALELFRPLVAGVAKLHEAGMIHRDIKPHNVFVADDGRLVLGDFGLVFFDDPTHTRISETYENVGSRDWMPMWATGMRIEQLKPTFDVFALGKLLWAILSGKQVLRAWYFDRDEFNVETLYPDDATMRHANTIFKECIVEDEEDCLPDATELLKRIDDVRRTLKMSGEVLDDKVKRTCRVCGSGTYRVVGQPKSTASIHNLGLTPAGMRTYKALSCSHCGHLQLFLFEGHHEPAAWRME